MARVERGQFVTYLADQQVVRLAADRTGDLAAECGDDVLGLLLTQTESRSAAEPAEGSITYSQTNGIGKRSNKYMNATRTQTEKLTDAAAGEIGSTEVTRQAPPNSWRFTDSPQGCIAITSLFSFKALTPSSGF